MFGAIHEQTFTCARPAAAPALAAFVPTDALSFLRTLHAARPNHCLLAADFDFLPEVRINLEFGDEVRWKLEFGDELLDSRPVSRRFCCVTFPPVQALRAFEQAATCMA